MIILSNSQSIVNRAITDDQRKMIRDICERIPSVSGAAFNSRNGELNTRCHPKTREDLLHQVTEWVQDPQGKPILWLSGAAGTGKSTISRTVAQSFYNQNQLGASFFFEKGKPERDPFKLFTTIASRLLWGIPDLIPHIKTAIDKEPEIATLTLELEELFNSLVLRPLKNLGRIHTSIVLVIDALDECEGDDDHIREVLRLLSRMRELENVQIRIFLTSRPELPVRLGFNDISEIYQSIVLEDIPNTTTEHDISIFLKDKLTKIKSDYNSQSSDPQLPDDWPGHKTIQELTKMAIPLFIVAATYYRFIGDTREWNPEQQLATILKYRTTGSPLDKTYLPVLDQFKVGFSETEFNIFTQDFKIIIGSIIILEDTLSIVSLAKLLDINKAKIQSKLQRLHSVLSIPSNPNQPIQLFHLSFREFLLDPKKENSDFWFWINEKAAHILLEKRCFELLLSLKRNICALEYPGMSRKELNDAKLNECLPKHIQYACSYWLYHFEHSGGRILDQDVVHKFLCKHFLHWLEALSLIGKIHNCISLVDTLRSLTDESRGSEVLGFLNDTRRFLLQNLRIIDEAPLQIYSVIVFSPRTSRIRTIFRDSVPEWIFKSPKTPESWGHELQKLEGHKRIINVIVFSPDGKLLVSGAFGEKIRLWDVKTGRKVKSFQADSSGELEACAFSPDGKQLVTILSYHSSEDERGSMTHWDMTVTYWDIITGRQIKYFPLCDIPTGLMGARTISPDGKRVAFVLERKVFVFRLDTMVREEPKIFLGDPSSIAFSPDLKQLAGAGMIDHSLILWDLETEGKTEVLRRHTKTISGVTFSGDGTHLVSASSDGRVILWDAQTGQYVEDLVRFNCGIMTLASFPDNKLVLGLADGTIEFWDEETCTGVTTTLKGHSREVDIVAFSPDGKQVVSASRDQTIRLWDVSSVEPPQKKPNLAITQPILKSIDFEGHELMVKVVVFSPDGKQLASASADCKTIIWDVETGEEVDSRIFNRPAEVIVFSPDGKQIALASSDGIIRTWALTTGKNKYYQGHDRWVSAVAFSPDGNQLVSVGEDRTVKLFTFATRKMRTFRLHDNLIRAIVFSPDGKQLASASYNGKTMVLNATTGEVETFEGQGRSVSAVAFSPDGQQLASASEDCTVMIWNIATGEPLGKVELPAVVKSLCFSSDGRHLETDRGVLDIPADSTSSTQSPLQALPGHIFLRDEWVTCDGKNLLWLPRDYRGECSAVCGKLLGIGQLSGAIKVFEFKV